MRAPAGPLAAEAAGKRRCPYWAGWVAALLALACKRQLPIDHYYWDFLRVLREQSPPVCTPRGTCRAPAHVSHSRLMLSPIVSHIPSCFRRKFRATEQGRNFSIVYVGTMDMKEADATGNDMYLSRLAKDYAARMVLVEPNAAHLDALRASIQEWGVQSPEVVNAAVCDRTGPSLLYFFHNQMYVDFPELKMNWNKSAGLDLGALARGHPSWMLPYIDSIRVRCLTPGDLLEEVQLPSQEVDMLIIDAEGYDLVLLDLFMVLPRFSPAYIQFEHLPYLFDRTAELRQLMPALEALAARGYTVRRHLQDYVAVRATEARPRTWAHAFTDAVERATCGFLRLCLETIYRIP